MHAARSIEDPTYPIFHVDALANAPAQTAPYPHIIASSLLAPSASSFLSRDFPAIDHPGFFPLKEEWRKGYFGQLIAELESEALPAVLSEKLGVDLIGKPRLITLRKWSAPGDGRIHNDSKSKICTALLYLMQEDRDDSSGRFRILRSNSDFENAKNEVDPKYGNFVAFKRTENSWHGHKPFVGERRVIQITWLQSWEDYYRKEKRGRFSWMLKAFR